VRIAGREQGSNGGNRVGFVHRPWGWERAGEKRKAQKNYGGEKGKAQLMQLDNKVKKPGGDRGRMGERAADVFCLRLSVEKRREKTTANKFAEKREEGGETFVQASGLLEKNVEGEKRWRVGAGLLD